MHPILPFTSKKTWQILKLKSKIDWQNIGKLELEVGHPIGDIEILFEKIPDKTIQGEIERLHKMQEGDKPDKPKPPLLDDEEIEDINDGLKTMVDLLDEIDRKTKQRF